MIDRVCADLNRDDSRFSFEPSIVAWVPLYFLVDDFSWAKTFGRRKVKHFVVKRSQSLDTTDVRTLLHISCFQQPNCIRTVCFLCVFSEFSHFWRRSSIATVFERDRNQIVKITLVCFLTIWGKNWCRRSAFDVSMYQFCILCSDLDSFNQKNEFRTREFERSGLIVLRENHLFSQRPIFIRRKLDGRSMPRRKLVTTFSRQRLQEKRRWILSWVQRNSADSIHRIDPILDTDVDYFW